MEGENTSDTGLDIEQASNTIAQDLGFGEQKHEDPIDEIVDDSVKKTDPVETDIEVPAAAKAEVKTEPSIRQAPKSWAKEHHEVWGKLDPKAQEIFELREKQMLDGLDQYKGDAGFGKQMKEVITPYNALLQSQGVDGPKAIQFLLNAHYKLSNAPPAERQDYFLQLAQSYGVDLKGIPQGTIDPQVKVLQEKIERLESGFTQREQASLNEARGRVSKEVESFASDPKHPYFEEVADDIVAMIRAGKPLEEAYEKAIWANPITRQKEIARLDTERQSQLQKKAKEEAEKSRRAAGSNIRSRDTQKAPTEPKGTMEDTMKNTLREIKARAH